MLQLHQKSAVLIQNAQNELFSKSKYLKKLQQLSPKLVVLVTLHLNSNFTKNEKILQFFGKVDIF